MRAFVDIDQMQALDRKTMRKRSWSSFELMKAVAKDMANLIRQKFTKKNSDILILCGPGNNGGDGYCLGGYLREFGYRVTFYPLFEPLSADCRAAAKWAEGSCTSRLNLKASKNYDLVIDAVFGSSGRAEMSIELAKTLKTINSWKSHRIALDIPTGIDSRKMRVHRNSFYADETFVVGYPKTSFLCKDVAEKLGRIIVIDPGFVPTDSRSKLWMLEPSDFWIPSLLRTAHKKGHCGVIAGSSATPGAAYLAAEAAHRVGCGYVSLLLAESQKRISIDLKSSSFLYKTQWSSKDLETFDSLVVGPGGSPNNLSFLDSVSCPQILDARALRNFKSQSLKEKADRLLTPHPGEAAYLLGWTVKEVVENSVEAVGKLIRVTRQSVYLKTCPAILGFRDEFHIQRPLYYVNMSINPAFARAGSGDVLAGILGGFCARRPKDFKRAVISSLIFQEAVGEELRESEAAISSDQLRLFSKAFTSLRT
ncbi:MAG: NAD(P)H-hydrate epimerase [Deltaproteobacteria bacterium CG11_big_fil_rev_8_21_14_0_20_45_16]|nr:MAG: NAD(P)H-hydrate epimerase [Deltaproteobacteria bacterium CG11_big_fil_rev_8_21_14_0_20_45_16]